MRRGIYSSGLMSQGEAIEEAKKKRIKKLEEENREHERFKHLLEIKREIKTMKTDMEILKRDVKIILSFIQEMKPDENKLTITPDETNKGWFFS